MTQHSVDPRSDCAGDWRGTVTAGLTPDGLLALHQALTGRAREIMVGKNHDYRGGSGDPFANFRGSVLFGVHPVIGILLRMQDKMMRVRTFAERGTLQVQGEGVGDAVVDIINYAVLLYGILGLPAPGGSAQ